MNNTPTHTVAAGKRLPAVIEKPVRAPHLSENFRGYTLDELRFQRTLTEVRRDYVKERLLGEIAALRSFRFFDAKKGKSGGKWLNPSVLSVAGKAFKLFSYVDYISLGITLFHSGRKLFSLFRRKK